MKEQPLLRERLTAQRFAEVVDRSITHRFRDESPGDRTVTGYIVSLNAADLGVAALCEAGDEVAWEHVVLTYRPLLYRAAAVLTGDDAAGQELADGLWAELYGVGHNLASVEPGSERRSLLRYYHGRSKLSTWLRSVLAQRHVDRIRREQRMTSLTASAGSETQPDVGAPDRADPTETPEPDQPRVAGLFQQALEEALATLDPRDRLRLSYYYIQTLTLAETGRLLDEHEATVSRKLARTRAALRQQVEHTMRVRHRLTPMEIDLCYQYVLSDGTVDLSQGLEP